MPNDARSAATFTGRPRALVATYRLQLGPGFGFAEAAAVAPYLAELGVSHLYLSPCLEAARGSTHGYDVVNPTRVSESLGGARGHAALCRALSRSGLGQIVDIVPNHMSNADRGNIWWWDVLQNGRRSRYAEYFDIDWTVGDPELAGRLVLPVLPDSYEHALESHDLELRLVRGAFEIRCGDRSFPLSPECAAELESAAECRPVADLVARYNADPALLDRLLDRQHYRLVEWRDPACQRNYRRFFDVDSLAAMRMDRDGVFDATHAVVMAWLRSGTIDGVRIDHIDGLRDPEGYLWRLASAAPEAKLFVEKILAPKEALPPTWPVSGTTGYEFLNLLEGLFLDPEGEAPLSACYERFTGNAEPFRTVAHATKHLMMQRGFGSDVQRLSGMLQRLARESDDAWRLRDLGHADFEVAVSEYLACLPVYRTYARPLGRASSRDADIGYVAEALTEVRARRPDLEPALIDFIAQIVLGRDDRGENFRLSLQEASGPVMAKGVEDTALYRHHRLLSKNEVGSDAASFTTSLDEFHATCRDTAEERPETLLATATHDTKRGEDVRARLDVLSEVPEAWRAAIERWSRMTAPYRTPRIDANDEYLFYQTLVGAYPLSKGRLKRYLLKAAREAKVHTSWRAPSAEYEAALEAFVDGALSSGAFVRDVNAFAETLVEPGRVVSLAKKLITLTAPGVPDLYNGTELWDLSLVDPDNRRPVDFELRQRLLGELSTLDARQAWARADDGLPKLLVVKTALRVRRAHPHAFGANGSYEPLRAAGAYADHVVAFVRGEDIITVVPRWTTKLEKGWAGTTLTLPSGTWFEAFSQKEFRCGPVRLDMLFVDFPVALFVRSRLKGAIDGNEASPDRSTPT